MGSVPMELSSASSAQYNLPRLLAQGIRHVDHFGFICRECSGGGSGGFHFVCYVFQCTNEALVRGRHCPLQTLWAMSALLSLRGWAELWSLADRAVFALIIHSWLIPFCYASETHLHFHFKFQYLWKICLLSPSALMEHWELVLMHSLHPSVVALFL